MGLEHSSRHLDWLDYARFIAAMSVVAFHYLANGPRNGRFSTISDFGPITHVAAYGYLGVHFFFMVSGFVIMFSAQNSTAKKFMVARIVRLWPAFIVCMTITALVRILWGGPDMQVTVAQYLANVTMMAKKFGQQNMDGVYWTLLLEIYFYTVVLLIIALNLIKKSEPIVYGWVLVILTYSIAGWRPPLIGPHSIYFASGCVLFFIYRDGIKVRNAIPLLICSVLATHTAMGEAARNAAERHTDLIPIVVGAIVMTFFAAFIFFGTKRFAPLKLPAAKTIGALTYPTYLLHAWAGYIILGKVISEENKWLAVVAMVLAVLVASYAVHKLIEDRPRQFWRRTFNALITPLFVAGRSFAASTRQKLLGPSASTNP